MSPAPTKTDPQIIEMPPQKMTVVVTKGDPNVITAQVMPALYGAAFPLKFARKKQDPALDFKVAAVRARYPDAHRVPKDQWTIIWGMPLPDDVAEVPQKVPGVVVTVETWDYGLVAQVLHLGPYSEEGPTVEHLHAFVAESGYVLAGPHEEEYLTRPDAKQMRTIIRYQVAKG